MKAKPKCDVCSYTEEEGSTPMIQHIRQCWPENMGLQSSEQSQGGREGNQIRFRTLYSSQGLTCRLCSEKMNYLVDLQQHMSIIHPFERFYKKERNQTIKRNLNKSESANQKPEPKEENNFISFEEVIQKEERPKSFPFTVMDGEKQLPIDKTNKDEFIMFDPEKNVQNKAGLLYCFSCDFATSDLTKFREHEKGHRRNQKKDEIHIEEFIHEVEEEEYLRGDGSFICQKQGCVYRTIDPFKFLQHQNSHIKFQKKVFEAINQRQGKGKKKPERLICARPQCAFQTCDADELIQHQKQHGKNKGTAQCLFCIFNGHKSQMKKHYETKHNIDFSQGLTVRKLKKNWSIMKVNASQKRKTNHDLLEEFRIENSTQRKVIEVLKSEQSLQKFRPGSLEYMLPKQVAGLDIALKIICIASKCVINIHDKWQKGQFKDQFKLVLQQQNVLDHYEDPFNLKNWIERAKDFGWLHEISESSAKVVNWKNGKKQYQNKLRTVLITPGENLNWYFFHLMQSPDVYNMALKMLDFSTNRIEFYKQFVAQPENVDRGASKKKFSINKEGKLYEVKARDRTQPLQSEINKVFHNDYFYCFLQKKDYEPLKKLDVFRQMILQNMWIKNLHQRNEMDNLVAKRGMTHAEYLKQLQEKEYDESREKYGLLNLRELQRAAEFQSDVEGAKRQLDIVLQNYSYGERLLEWANLNGMTLKELEENRMNKEMGDSDDDDDDIYEEEQEEEESDEEFD